MKQPDKPAGMQGGQKTTSFARITEKETEEVDELIGALNRRRGSDEDLNMRDTGFDQFPRN